MKEKLWTKAQFTFPLKNERSTGTSKQKRDTKINKKKEEKFLVFEIFFINHAALEVLAIFSKVSTCDYNGKAFMINEC